jgi:glycosyltransferase involved in cell wall biosynthesis
VARVAGVKILYVTCDRHPSPKGASVRIGLTLDAFRAGGHEVEHFTPAEAEDSPASGNFLERMMAFRSRTAHWLASRPADVVQFRGLWEGVAALDWARRTGARAIWEAHGFPSVELAYHHPRLRGNHRLLGKIVDEERALATGVDGLLVPSRTSALFVRRMGVDPARVAVVPNGVDVACFVPPAVPPPDAPPFRIVYQGTLSPWQGLETLLEALALLRGRGLVELHVVGPLKASWRRRLRSQARRLHVHHALHLSGPMEQRDLPPVLASAHLCVAPLAADPRNAMQGCCPIKVLEYMAAGRPILSTRLAPVEEILVDGDTALLVVPGSAAALADGIAWFLDHPGEREAMGLRARAAVESRFTTEAFRENLGAALARLVAPRAARMAS